MTTSRSFDRELEQWLDEQAPVKGPPGLHAAVLERAGPRQRPGWQVRLRGDAYPARAGLSGRPALAASLVIAALALLLVGAALAGAFRTQPKPPGASAVIAYSVFENKRREGQTSFTYFVHADGSGNERIATGTCPTFSANGAAMTYRSHWAGGDLIAAAADGSSPHRLPVTVDIFYRDNAYALSPDGSRVAWFEPINEILFPQPDGSAEAFGSRNELWVAPVAGGPGTRIVPVSDDPTESFGMLAWSPDGTTIAFEGRLAVPSATGLTFRRAVYLVDASGANLRTLTTRPLAHSAAYGIAWSPDGRFIAYLGLPDGSAVPSGPVRDLVFDSPAPDVFVVRADGTGDHQVTNTQGFESRPAWSPDGTRLAYLASDDGERYRLAVVAMDGPEPVAPAELGPESVSFTWWPDSMTLLAVDALSIRSVDGALERSPTVLVDLTSWPRDTKLDQIYSTDYEGCAPSWRRLEP